MSETGKGKGEASKNVKRSDVVSCKRSSEIAALVGMDGKRFRDRVRKLGVYVTKGDTLTDAVKVEAVESFGYTVK